MSELLEFTVPDWIGVAGAVAILFAFGANLTAKWETTDAIYKLFNFGGAAAVAFSLLFRPNLPALIVEILWAVVSLIALMRPERLEQGYSADEIYFRSPPFGDPSPPLWYQVLPRYLWERRRARLRFITERRRAWRLFNAASSSMRALAESVAAPGLTIDSGTVRLEILSIRHILDDRALSCISAGAREALEQLFQDTQARLTSGSAGVPELVAALQRALEAQRRTLDPWVPRQSEVSASSARTRDPASDPPNEKEEQEEKFTPDEAAILAGVTEKFYGSWAFKIIGGALVAAAFLAGAGTLFLGAHSLSLREDLEKTEKKGEDEIKANTKLLQDSIDKQMAAVSLATTEIQNKKDDFERNVIAGRERIVAATNDFVSKSDQVQKRIADIVVQRLDSELKQPLSAISIQIREKGETALSQIDRVTRESLDPLTTRGSDIAGKLDQLRETLTKEDNELRTQAPALDRLKGVGANLDEANDKLSKVEAKENELANSVTRARTQADLTASHAEAARQAAELAAQARTKAVSDLQSIGNGTADQERALGAIISRIENLKKQIEASETQLKNGLPVALNSTALTQAMSPLSARVAKLEDRLNHQPSAPTPPDITGLTARLSKLEERLDRVVPPQGTLDLGPLTARVAKLEDRLDHLTPAPQAPAVPALPTSEGKLNLSQKMLIQWALAYRGFNPGEIDGNFGRIGSNSRTRGAIERLREALRSRARGELTHDEITELLTPAQ